MTSDEIEEMVRDLIEEHLADDDAKAALKSLDKRVEASGSKRPRACRGRRGR